MLCIVGIDSIVVGCFDGRQSGNLFLLQLENEAATKSLRPSLGGFGWFGHWIDARMTPDRSFKSCVF